MRLDLSAKFKYESSTVIVFVGIKYSMRDILSDLDPQTSVYVRYGK